MPAVGKVTLDIRDYESMLKRMQKSTASAAAASSRSFQRVGGDLNKGTETAQKMASAFGGALAPVSKLGGAVMALASGPVAALSAGIALLATVGVKVWDKLTLSAEEYAAKLERNVRDQESALSRLRNQQGADNAYLKTLQDMASVGELTTTEMDAAQRMVDLLNSRYKDLGLTIQDVIGNTSKLSEAQRKMAEEQSRREQGLLERQKAALSDSAAASAKMALKEQSSLVSMNISGLGENGFEAAFGAKGAEAFRNERAATRKRMAASLASPLSAIGAGAYSEMQFQKLAQNMTSGIMANGTSEEKIRLATAMRDNAKTKEDMDNWQKVIDALMKVAELDLKIKGEEDRRARMDLDARKADEAAASASTSSKEDTFQGYVTRDQYRATRNKLMSMMGMGEAAAIQSAVEQAQDAAYKRGETLSDYDRAEVERMAKLNYQLENYQKPRMEEIKTNSLTARGGFASGAFVGKDDTQKSILNTNKEMLKQLEEVNKNLTESEAD